MKIAVMKETHEGEMRVPLIPPTADKLVKLGAEVVAATVLCFAGVSITSLEITEGFTLPMGWFAYPLTLMWIVGITNAVNLSDGLDGLAGGVTLLSLGAVALLANGSTPIWMPPQKTITNTARNCPRTASSNPSISIFIASIWVNPAHSTTARRGRMATGVP